MRRLASFGMLTLLASCSGGGPKKAEVPSLNPETANQLLNFDHKAANWLTYVKKQNPACIYQVDLPDQASHPTEIGIEHLVTCGGRPAPKEFDAAVTFVYDPGTQKWTIARFTS